MADGIISSAASGAKAVLLGAKNAQAMYKRSSINRLAKDLILQYPIIFSGDIDNDSAVIIGKAMEQLYASLQLMVLSADTAFGVDPTQHAGVRDLLSQYHSNDDSPNVTRYLGNGISNVANFISTFEGAEIKSVTESAKGLTFDANELWEYTDDGIVMESLNDMYQPGNAIIDTIESIADGLLKATEDLDDDDGYGKTANFLNNHLSDDGQQRMGLKEFNGSLSGLDPRDRPQGGQFTKVKDALDRNTKIEPVLLDVEFFVQDGKGSRVQKATIGISVMPRFVPSPVMRANCIKALQHNNVGLQFVQWTRGEKKVVKDFIFNISQIKEDALTKDRYDKWFTALRKRKRNSKILRSGGSNINPLTTLVLTKNDVALIKQNANIDLTSERNATKLMDSLYLLALIIFDTDTGMVSTLLDGNPYFTETTLESLKRNSRSNNDTLVIQEMLKIMGR